MWGSFYTPKFKCFLCQGSGSIHICKNPIKENIIKKKNDKLRDIGEEEVIIGNDEVICFQCNGQGIFQIDVDNNDFKQRHKNL